MAGCNKGSYCSSFSHTIVSRINAGSDMYRCVSDMHNCVNDTDSCVSDITMVLLLGTVNVFMLSPNEQDME
jgi:hypothetical protein